MSAGGTPHAASIVANLDIETPTGDRLTLRGDGGDLTLSAASVAALWRTRQIGHTVLDFGLTPKIMARLPVQVNVNVGNHVVARVEPTAFGGVRLRMRWLGLLRALF